MNVLTVSLTAACISSRELYLKASATEKNKIKQGSCLMWPVVCRPDVQVITANPKTAGVARWNFVALWGHRQSQGDTAALDYCKKVRLGTSFAANCKAAGCMAKVVSRQCCITTVECSTCLCQVDSHLITILTQPRPISKLALVQKTPQQVMHKTLGASDWKDVIQSYGMGQTLTLLNTLVQIVNYNWAAQVFENVPIQPRDAREASDCFYKQGQGDVSLNYENEVILTNETYGDNALPYVVPDNNVLVSGTLLCKPKLSHL